MLCSPPSRWARWLLSPMRPFVAEPLKPSSAPSTSHRQPRGISILGSLDMYPEQIDRSELRSTSMIMVSPSSTIRVDLAQSSTGRLVLRSSDVGSFLGLLRVTFVSSHFGVLG